MCGFLGPQAAITPECTEAPGIMGPFVSHGDGVEGSTVLRGGPHDLLVIANIRIAESEREINASVIARRRAYCPVRRVGLSGMVASHIRVGQWVGSGGKPFAVQAPDVRRINVLVLGLSQEVLAWIRWADKAELS
jgi:hypothetical protein